MTTRSPAPIALAPAPPEPGSVLHIAVCVPHGSDSYSIHHAKSLELLVHTPHSFEGHPIVLHEFSLLGDEYSRARNQIMADVIRAEGEHGFRFSHTLWVDDDVVVTPDLVVRLLAHKLPMVSGLYVSRRDPHHPIAYRQSTDPEHPHRCWALLSPPSVLDEVDAVGFGSVLIRRDVYDHLPRPFFAWRGVDRAGEDIYDLLPQSSTGDREIGTDDKTVGEDLYFCAQVKAAGYRIHLDPDAAVGHVGSVIWGVEHYRERERGYRRAPQPGKLSILIMAGPAPKLWSARTLETEGLGGSETAVAYVARELVLRHRHSVTVCASSPYDDCEGVSYRPLELAPDLVRQPWDMVIVSRWRDCLPHLTQDTNLIRRTLFWAHDFYRHSSELRPVYELTNGIVAVSPEHGRRTFALMDQSREFTRSIIPNGVDMALFAGEEERVPHRFLWTSNPNRGLPSALRYFRRIRSWMPDAELHIYGRASVYGWGSQEEVAYLPWKNEPGVVLHDPLPKAELARELMKAWCWFYPTHWPETFSIAALEAQAAGTPVISVPYAALPDTVKGGILDWDVEGAVRELDKDEDYWKLLSLEGKDWARQHDWRNIGGVWNNLLNAELAKD